MRRFPNAPHNSPASDTGAESEHGAGTTNQEARILDLSSFYEALNDQPQQMTAQHSNPDFLTHAVPPGAQSSSGRQPDQHTAREPCEQMSRAHSSQSSSMPFYRHITHLSLPEADTSHTYNWESCGHEPLSRAQHRFFEVSQTHRSPGYLFENSWPNLFGRSRRESTYLPHESPWQEPNRNSLHVDCCEVEQQTAFTGNLSYDISVRRCQRREGMQYPTNPHLIPPYMPYQMPSLERLHLENINSPQFQGLTGNDQIWSSSSGYGLEMPFDSRRQDANQRRQYRSVIEYIEEQMHGISGAPNALSANRGLAALTPCFGMMIEMQEMIESRRAIRERMTAEREAMIAELAAQQAASTLLRQAEIDAFRKCKEEQNEAYNESLEADRLKEAIKQSEREAKEQQKRKAETDNKRNELKKQNLKIKILEETPNNDPSVIRLRLRTSDGRQISRNFRRHDRLSSLHDFIFSRDDLPDRFSVTSGFPRCRLPCRSPSHHRPDPTFAEAGVGDRTLLLVHELSDEEDAEEGRDTSKPIDEEPSQGQGGCEQ